MGRVLNTTAFVYKAFAFLTAPFGDRGEKDGPPHRLNSRERERLAGSEAVARDGSGLQDCPVGPTCHKI